MCTWREPTDAFGQGCWELMSNQLSIARVVSNGIGNQQLQFEGNCYDFEAIHFSEVKIEAFRSLLIAL